MKIWIGGGIGHGKSTLAKQLGERLKIQVLDLDTLVFRDNSGARNSEEEVVKNLNKFMKENKSWIIEGAQKREWCELGFKNVDFVILLKLNRIVALTRFFKRQFKLMLRWKHQRGNWKTKIGWIWHYERDDFPRYLSLIRKYSKKSLIIHNQKELDGALKRITARFINLQN